MSTAVETGKQISPAIGQIEARKLAGQLIMIRMPGTALDAEAAAFVRDNHIRAICLFRQNMANGEQLSRFTTDLRDVMGAEALIGIDQEGGAVVRSTWLPQPPAAMSLGASADPELCRQVGAAVARGVKSLGFNWNFAPVLDLNNNVDNPVISERSFGSDPQQAATLAMAWMEGSLGVGVACCVKHFPGHGDTNVDSHRDLPSVDKSRPQLDALELAPFRQAAPHAPAVMTAHIVYPQLDADYPATMSKAILTGILRDEWNYEGVVITDGMDMHAIAGHYGVGRAAVLALQAGADLVMALGTRETQKETLDTITAAILDGSLPLASLQRKLERVRKLTVAYPAGPATYQTEAQDQALMLQAWQRGLTQYRQPLAPAPGSKLRLVISADVASDGVSEAGVPAAKVSALLARHFDVDTVTFGKPDAFDWASLPQDGRYTVLASTVRLRYSEQVRKHWKPDLHLALWNPFQCLDIAAPALISYGFSAPALEAVAAWLAGTAVAAGVLPVAGFDAA
jgi:beta-N-acetylhexosaminidase